MPEWTSEQLRAIETVGRDVYVTASAGTGKTAVLSARCIKQIKDCNANISEFLVLTFTEAAAEEMSTRIGGLLRDLYRQSRDERIREQLLLLDSAQISTIHSFCQAIIREHFYVLGIDPAFGIVSDDEQKLIKTRVLKEVVEDAFNDEAIRQGLNTLLFGRDVMAGARGFLDEVIDIHAFLDSAVSRDDWYEAANRFAIEGVEGELGERQKQIILEKLEVCVKQFELMKRLDAKFADGHWADQINTEILPAVEVLINAVSMREAGWEKAIISFAKPKFKNKPKGFDDELKNRIQGPAKKAFETIAQLRSIAVINPRYEEVVAGASSEQTKIMVELVKRFERKYRKAKETINCLDFADLEHYALKLLSENIEIADTLKKRFKFVFVDEFQDINPLQEKIINSVCSGDNMFVVGDVKQSIYAFRHSDPSIFIGKLKKANDSEKSNEPLRIDLSKNFRSRDGVLKFANTVFERIMCESIGGIDYDERARLAAGFKYEEVGGPVVRIDIIDETAEASGPADDEDEKKVSGTFSLNEGAEQGVISAAQKQAALIVKHIRQLIKDEVKVYDKLVDGYRPVQYGDIVILMRSLAGSAKEYVELLRKANIPVSSQSSAGYFEATEITDMLSLLKVLDNPQRDIELAAVMRSPLFEIADTELALIRGHGEKINKGMNYYQCVAEYSQNGGDETLRSKIMSLLSLLDEWRSIGRGGQIADLVWQVYRQTGYLAFVAGTVSGEQRYANLLKLHDRAIQFEGFADAKSASLGRFVEFIEELLDGEHDWAPAEPDGDNENAVQIMSVHKSKGLEYPVVFLAETNRGFNLADSRGQCLTDRTGVMGIKVIDGETRYGFRTLGQQVVAEEKKKEKIAEEMRILYVAMTRARERLYICASKKLNECVKILAECGSDKPMDFLVGSVKCNFDWVLYGLGGYAEFENLFDGGQRISNELFEACVHDSDELEKQASEILYNKKEDLNKLPLTNVRGSEDVFEQVKNVLAWEYEHQEDTLKQAKTSVTEITHRDDEYFVADHSAALSRLPEVLSDDKKSNAIAIGSGTHLLVNRCIEEKLFEFKQIQSRRNKLIEDGFVSEGVGKKISVEGIAGFFGQEPGKLAITNTVYSEWPFTVDEDGVVVQGIIDCLIETDEGLIVIDFKTGRNTESKRVVYSKQLQYYAKAATKILDKEVIGKYLCFLDSNEIVVI